MLRRARSSWFLNALLVLGLLMPASALAAGPCCCFGNDQPTAQTQEIVHSCCSTQGETPEPSGDEPTDDGTTCDDCDCPGACCTPSKAPVSANSIASGIPVFDRDELSRPVGDRWTDPGEVFELVHPPRA